MNIKDENRTPVDEIEAQEIRDDLIFALKNTKPIELEEASDDTLSTYDVCGDSIMGNMYEYEIDFNLDVDVNFSERDVFDPNDKPVEGSVWANIVLIHVLDDGEELFEASADDEVEKLFNDLISMNFGSDYWAERHEDHFAYEEPE